MTHIQQYILGQSFADYRAADGLNFSALKLLKHSAGACWNAINEPRYSPGTTAMQFGTAAHMAVLEPEAYAITYARAPDGLRMDPRTKAYKEAVQLAGGGDLRLLKAGDFDRIAAIADSLRDAHPWLFTGHTEVSIYWTETVDGVTIPCKARPDALCSAGFWDLKTCKSVQPHAFESGAMSYDYPAQLAFYRRGLRALDLLSGDGVWLVGAESAGEEEAVFDMADAMDYGDDIIDAWLQEYVACNERGTWPRMIEQEPIKFQLPRWAVGTDNIDDEIELG